MQIPVGFGQINWRLGGVALPSGAEVTLGFEQITPLTAAEFAQGANGAFGTNVMPVLTDDVSLLSTLVKLGPNATGASAEFFAPVVGGTDQLTCSPNMAYLVHKRSELGGREGRGRMYLPGVGEIYVDHTGAITGARQTALQTAVDELVVDLVAAQMQPVLLHNSATVPTEITSLTVDAVAATQRRRMRR